MGTFRGEPTLAPKSVLVALVLFVLLVLTVALWKIGYQISDEQTITLTITDKEVKESPDGKKYLIFTKDEVFENTDNFLIQKFNSSDLYSILKVDSTYIVKVVGKRIQVLNSYRNIVEIIDKKESIDTVM